MNRRAFIQALMGAAVLPAARKIYVFAPPRGWSANDPYIYFPEDNPQCWAYRYVYRNDLTGCVSDPITDLRETPWARELVNSQHSA